MRHGYRIVYNKKEKKNSQSGFLILVLDFDPDTYYIYYIDKCR